MTGAVIRIDDKAVVDALDRLLKAAGDLRPALKNIGEYEAQSTKDRIAREETPEGTKFAPLNPLYARTKKGPGILRGSTGQLASIIYQLAGDDAVEVGSDRVYSAIHQFGGEIRPRNAAALVFSMGGKTFTVDHVTIPARPYLGISDADRTEILGILADFLDEASGGSITR